MADELALRFVVDVDGTTKTMLSVTEDIKNGDVYIDLKAADHFLDAEHLLKESGETDLHGKAIKLQRYSIHPSLKSPTKINVIKQTILFEDGKEQEVVRHHTKAIKQTNSFAPVYFKMCTDFFPEKYDTREHSDVNIKIDSIKSADGFLLYFGVFVGNKDRIFDIKENNTFKYKQAKVGLFNIVLVWSFIPFLPLGMGHLVHVRTVGDSETNPDIRAASDELARGFPEQEAINFYFSILESAKPVFFTKVAREHELDSSMKNYLDEINAGYFVFAEPDPERFKFKYWLSRLNSPRKI